MQEAPRQPAPVCPELAGKGWVRGRVVLMQPLPLQEPGDRTLAEDEASPENVPATDPSAFTRAEDAPRIKVGIEWDESGSTSHFEVYEGGSVTIDRGVVVGDSVDLTASQGWVRIVLAERDADPDPESVRKTMAYPADLLAFVGQQAKRRGNDLASMMREVLYTWAVDQGFRDGGARRGNSWSREKWRQRTQRRGVQRVIEALIDRLESVLPPNVSPDEMQRVVGETFGPTRKLAGHTPAGYPWGLVEQASATLNQFGLKSGASCGEVNEWLIDSLAGWVKRLSWTADPTAAPAGASLESAGAAQALADKMTDDFCERWLRSRH